MNARLGRSVGDTVIQVMVESLERNIRASDTAARVDWDEFAVILPETDKTEAQLVAQRIIADFKVSFAATVSGSAKFSTAFGVAIFPPGAREADELLAAADKRIVAIRRR